MSNNSERHIEVRVGFFVILGLVILAWVTFQVQDVGALFKGRQTLKIRANHASGLNPGDTVAVAGMKVGEVGEMKLVKGLVEIELMIDRDIMIDDKAEAVIEWAGLLGTRYVDITVGDGNPLGDGDFVTLGKEPVKLGEVLAKIDTATSELKKVFEDQELTGKIANTFDGVAQLVDKLKKGEGALGRLLTDESMSKALGDFVRGLSKDSTLGKLFSSDELYDDIKAMSKQLSDFSAKLAKKDSSLGRLVNSDDLYNEAEAIVKSLKSAAQRLDKVVADNDARIAAIIKDLETTVPEAKAAFAEIKKMGQQVDKGEGLLPALISDKKMRTDVQDALDRISASAKQLEAFTNSIKDGKGVLGKLTHDTKLAEDLAKTAESLRVVAGRLEKGEGTIGRLTKDDDLYKDIKKLTGDLRETLRRVKEQVPVSTFASVLMSAF